MKLSIAERTVLLSALPQEGNVATLKIIRELQGELGFSEEESGLLNLQTKNGAVGWDPEVEKTLDQKDVEIGPVALSVITAAFIERSNAGQLHISWLPVYERFCEDGLHVVEKEE